MGVRVNTKRCSKRCIPWDYYISQSVFASVFQLQGMEKDVSIYSDASLIHLICSYLFVNEKESMAGKITFFDIKRTFPLLCRFSLFLFMLSQYLRINILPWIRFHLFILKKTCKYDEEINKCHSFGGRRQTSKSQLRTIHDICSSISLMRFGSLYFFNSFFRAWHSEII